MTAQQIYDAVLAHVGGDQFTNWYVGITSDIQQRLFGYHSVHRTNHRWIHGTAMNSDHARSAETALLALGFDGGDGGGDVGSLNVYAFRKDAGTIR